MRTLKKKDPRTRNIPIIGMSAYAETSEREKAIATGCNEFDAKPIDSELRRDYSARACEAQIDAPTVLIRMARRPDPSALIRQPAVSW